MNGAINIKGGYSSDDEQVGFWLPHPNVSAVSSRFAHSPIEPSYMHTDGCPISARAKAPCAARTPPCQ